MNGQEFRNLAGLELVKLYEQARNVSGLFPEIKFIRDVLHAPFNLEFGVRRDANPDNSNSYDLDFASRLFTLSEGFEAAWLRMASDLKISPENLGRGLRAFFLHELYHISHGLTSPRHSDARNAQTSTYTVDYFADVSAALAGFYLDPSPDGSWQSRFADALFGVWLAMIVFQFPPAEHEIKLLRFKRHFLIHYQYHRILRSRLERPTDMHLLFCPPVDFAKLSSGMNINPSAVLKAYDESEGAFMWMVVPDGEGLPRFIRCRPERTRVENLVRAIFAPEISLSHSYFEHLFDQEAYLLGGLTGQGAATPLTRHLSSPH